MNSPAASPVRRLLSHWRWIAGAGVLVALYALAGFLLVPKLALGSIDDFVTQRLGKRVTVEQLEFNPFRLAATVTGFRLTEPDGRPLVAFHTLFANMQLASLWHGGLTFDEISLTEPAVDAVIDAAGQLNLASLVPPSAEPAAEAEPEQPLPALRIGLLKVAAGRVALEDQTRATPFRATVTPIEFTLTDFRTAADYQNAYEFAGMTQAGEQLRWAGEFSVQPLGSTGTFAVTGLKAGTLWSYLQDQVAFTLPTGTIDLGGSYRVAVNERNAIDLGIELPELKLTDVSVGPREQPQQTWIRIPELVVRQTSFSLLERRVSVGELALGNPSLTVWREPDGSINLQRLAGTGPTDAAVTEQAAAPGEAPLPDAAGARWQLALGQARVTAMTIDAEDRAVSPAVAMALSPLSFTLANVSSDLGRSVDVTADIGINGTGTLTATGTVRPRPLLASLDLELKDFGLPVLQPYVAEAAAMTVDSGRLGIKGHVDYDAAAVAPAPQLRFAGSLDVAEFASRDQALGEDFVKVGLLNVTGIDYAFNPGRLAIERILAREPYARVVISEAAELNIAQILGSGSGSGTATPAAPPVPGAAPRATSPMPARINAVVVENGSAHFADYSVTPSFATAIQSLAGTVRGLSSDAATRAAVDLKGNVDRFSPVVIAGEVNLLSAALYTDIAMSFANMELTTFNPYSGKFAGYNIAQGKLSTELRYKVQDRALEAEHHIVLDQLEFGDATDSKDAVPLPVKLAVALLKDPNGVIEIDLPVRGSLDDPSFRIGPIVWQAFVGLMRRIVTAPFALLGSLIGGGEDLSFIDFAAGSAALSAEAAQKLDSLSRALAERPALRLDIPLSTQGAVDAEAMAREALALTVPPAPADTADVTALSQYLGALRREATRVAGTPPAPAAAAAASPSAAELRAAIDAEEATLLARLAPSADQLEALGRRRAEVVQEALLASGSLDPVRVFLTTRAMGAQADTGVRMELKLE